MSVSNRVTKIYQEQLANRDLRLADEVVLLGATVGVR